MQKLSRPRASQGRGWIGLIAAALVLAGCAAVPRAAVSSAAAAEPVWPFLASDLPADPAFRFGRLPNGMRYIIRKNQRPEGTALVRIDIQAGSLDERADERGFAHFVEHMAFNGSTNVPEGEMVQLLERNGLAFGADTNASTGFEQTQYKLDLPRNDPKLLDTALMLMRETVSELKFDDDAVSRERGVVLSELRDSVTFARRNLEDQLAFLYPDATYPNRLPIGVPETLNAATGASLRAFWEREYTPADTTLVVVGDFDPELVEQKIVAEFGDWAGRAPTPRLDQGTVKPKQKAATDVFIDPALSERVTVSRHGKWQDDTDTAARRRVNLLREIGYGIVNRRLQRVARQVDPPFRGAGFGTSEVFEIGRTTNLIVEVVDGQWRRGLEAVAQEYRRALTFGFTPAEVAEQIANQRAAQVNAARAAETRSNAALVELALAVVDDERVPTTPQSSLERFEAFAPSITPARVLAALRDEAVPLDKPLIRLQGRTPPEGGEAAIREAWNAAMRQDIARVDAGADAAWAYSDFGPAGTVVSDGVDPVLGIRTVRFANGVMLNLKRTTLEQDRVQLSLAIDGGDLLDTRANPYATEMTPFLIQGGLGKHSQDELQSILAGRTVSGNLGTNDDSFVARATTTPADLELQLQLLAAFISDPGYRPEGELQYKLNIANFFARAFATPGSALSNSQGKVLSDGDPRFTLGRADEYQGLGFAKLRQDIGDRLARGAIEIGLVGAFEEEAAIALVAKTFGALPSREAEFRDYADSRKRGFTDKRTVSVVRHTGDPSQAIVRVVWPTRDDSDPVEAMQLELLERVLRLELTDGLREKLGKSYSPSASSALSRAYPGYGTFSITASVEAAEVAATRQAIAAIVRELRDKPIGDDQLARAKAPLIEEYANLLKRNAGWLALVDRAQSEPERIDRFAKASDRIRAVSARDIQALARRYLALDKAVSLIVLPEGKSARARKPTGPLHLPQVSGIGIGAGKSPPGKGRSR
ncbi:MAG: insulinase family protein [Novosphingobium sp.]|nr:insulinase family protein [Novosphingobium sp.]